VPSEFGLMKRLTACAFAVSALDGKSG